MRDRYYSGDYGETGYRWRHANPYWPPGEGRWESGPYRGALGYRDSPEGYARDYDEDRRAIGEAGWNQHPWNRHGSQERPGLLRRIFGRGPKGYKRSDERIREDICETLIYTDSIDSSEVSIDVHNGKATLEGTVPERRMKHEIEDIVASCVGVDDVENRIKVERPRQLLMD